MGPDKYSEHDIQDYAAGRFTGDKASLEDYINQSPTALIQIKEYEKVYAVLSLDQTPSLSFDLADRLIARIEENTSKKDSMQFRMLAYGLILLSGIGLFFTYRHFYARQLFSSSLDSGVLFISALVIILFSIIFYRIEVKEKEKYLAFIVSANEV